MKTKQDFPSINERPPEGIKDDGTSYRVLIVDDSLFVAKQLGQILASEGYEVIATAADGKEGLDKYKELLDMGVISQEEFDAKKKQLLGL